MNGLNNKTTLDGPKKTPHLKYEALTVQFRFFRRVGINC